MGRQRLTGVTGGGGPERNEPDPIELRLFTAEHNPDTSQVDLHGLSKVEAEEGVERAVHACYMKGEHALRVITGKGTGAVREAALNYLRRHPLVERVRESTRPGYVGGEILAAIVPNK